MEIRDAATLILLRHNEDGAPQVLMGQRGAGAVFMPGKFVFPGGAVDKGDLTIAAEPPRDAETRRRLAVGTEPDMARALPLAAVRELWEETGLRLGRPDPRAPDLAVPDEWRGFFAAGLVPDPAPLRLVFRAVTPPGRPRRFDARFFLADAGVLAPGEALHAGDGELSFLQWLEIPAARDLPLPFITGVVLSELEAALADPHTPRPVPFFRHDEAGSHFAML
jgi:8-oxo-dGTP pyrophosphatase MutT (NUDIX family)